MKTYRNLLLLAGISSLLLLSGCSILWNTMASEKSMQDNFFTYIGQNPFNPQAMDGIILGKISFGDGGSIFSVSRLDNDNKISSTPETLKLSYCVTKKRGILPKKKKVYNVETVDIYAGNAPNDRKDAFKPILGTGSFIKSIYGGTSGSFAKNMNALQTQLPSGWFLIRLPVGKYQITNLEHEGVAVGNEYITTTTCTESSGPIFEVKKGVINYIGKYAYNPEVQFSTDLNEAKKMVTQGISRIKVIDPQWEIVSAY